MLGYFGHGVNLGFCCFFFLHMYIEFMFTNTIVIYMTAELNPILVSNASVSHNSLNNLNLEHTDSNYRQNLLV